MPDARSIALPAPGLSTAHISPSLSGLPHFLRENPFIGITKNGNLAHISFGTARKSGRVGGGLRSAITEFSKASRRRMQTLLNSLDRKRAPVPVLITLTYHEEWDSDPSVWKDQLDAFRKRLERKYGSLSAIWRLEYQRRGAPHFHLLVFFWEQPSRDRASLLADLRGEVGYMWWEVTGKTSDEHLLAGTRCELPRSWKGANVYLSKYMVKLESLSPGAAPPGRFWGVWRKNLLPILWEVHQLTLRQAFTLRRILRRYAKIRSTHRLSAFEVFCGYQSGTRLLAAYGVSRT